MNIRLIARIVLIAAAIALIVFAGLLASGQHTAIWLVLVAVIFVLTLVVGFMPKKRQQS